MISSQTSSLMRKPFFTTTSRPFRTFYGHGNLNVIHSFKLVKPWCGDYVPVPRGKEVPKCGHRLSFFISYSQDCSGSDDFPYFDRDGSKIVDVRVSSSYTRIGPARNICFRPIGDGAGVGHCVEAGQKVEIHYKLYDNQSLKARYSTYSTHGPPTIGPGKNDICQGLYEGIVGMRVGQTRRIVLPPSFDLTGEHPKTIGFNPMKLFSGKPPADSNEHRIYDVSLVAIKP